MRSNPTQEAINTGAIIVGVVGGVIIIVLLLILLWLLDKKADKEKKNKHQKARRASYLQAEADAGLPPQRPLGESPLSPPGGADFEAARRRQSAPWQWPSLRQREDDDDDDADINDNDFAKDRAQRAAMSPLLSGVGDIPSRPGSGYNPRGQGISPAGSVDYSSWALLQGPPPAAGCATGPQRAFPKPGGPLQYSEEDLSRPIGGRADAASGYAPLSEPPGARRHASTTAVPADSRLAGGGEGAPGGIVRSDSWAAPRFSNSGRTPLPQPADMGPRTNVSGSPLVSAAPWRPGLGGPSPIISGSSSRWRPSRLGRRTPAMADDGEAGREGAEAAAGSGGRGFSSLRHQRSQTATGLTGGGQSETQLARRGPGPERHVTAHGHVPGPGRGLSGEVVAGARSGSLSARPRSSSPDHLIATSDEGGDTEDDDVIARLRSPGVDGMAARSSSLDLVPTTQREGQPLLLPTGMGEHVFPTTAITSTWNGSFISGLPPSASGHLSVLGTGPDGGGVGSGQAQGLRSESTLDGRPSGGGGGGERKPRWSLWGRREVKAVDAGGDGAGGITMLSNPVYRSTSPQGGPPSASEATATPSPGNPEGTGPLPPRHTTRLGVAGRGGGNGAASATPANAALATSHSWLLVPDSADPRSSASVPSMRRPPATHHGFSQPAPTASVGPAPTHALLSPRLLRREFDSASPRRSTLAGHIVSSGVVPGRDAGPDTGGRRRTVQHWDEDGGEFTRRQHSSRPTYHSHLAGDVRARPPIEALMATERSLPGSPRRASLVLPDSAFAAGQSVQAANYRDAD